MNLRGIMTILFIAAFSAQSEESLLIKYFNKQPAGKMSGMGTVIEPRYISGDAFLTYNIDKAEFNFDFESKATQVKANFNFNPKDGLRVLQNIENRKQNFVVFSGSLWFDKIISQPFMSKEKVRTLFLSSLPFEAEYDNGSISYTLKIKSEVNKDAMDKLSIAFSEDGKLEFIDLEQAFNASHLRFAPSQEIPHRDLAHSNL